MSLFGRQRGANGGENWYPFPSFFQNLKEYDFPSQLLKFNRCQRFSPAVQETLGCGDVGARQTSTAGLPTPSGNRRAAPRTCAPLPPCLAAALAPLPGKQPLLPFPVTAASTSAPISPPLVALLLAHANAGAHLPRVLDCWAKTKGDGGFGEVDAMQRQRGEDVWASHWKDGREKYIL